MKYFGTDGIRGIYGDMLTESVALKCGNALSRLCHKRKVIVGRDNRPSGKNLSRCLCSGLVFGGVSVIDVGVATTPSISYLAQKYNCDFGVVISASHNPVEYNGIKIFNGNGRKIDEKTELLIEQYMDEFVYADNGKYERNRTIIKDYINFLIQLVPEVKDVKFAVDCSNGASQFIAKQVFEKVKDNVSFIGVGSGQEINRRCGATYPQKLANYVKKHNLDFGFCFDGDADRIVFVDKSNIYDGDNILYCLAMQMNPKTVVGTVTTNMGLEKILNKNNIKLVRANVGDKYVTEQMLNEQTFLGGEQSGHIVVNRYMPTGDGLLIAVLLLNLLNNGDFKKLFTFEKYPQVQINVNVSDPQNVIQSKTLLQEIEKAKNILQDRGRVLVRPSGTESKVRIMVESQDENLAKQLAEKIASAVGE